MSGNLTYKYACSVRHHVLYNQQRNELTLASEENSSGQPPMNSLDFVLHIKGGVPKKFTKLPLYSPNRKLYQQLGASMGTIFVLTKTKIGSGEYQV
jgi:hypothetical protein